MTQIRLQEPTLEEYNLDASIYKDYREKNARLEEKVRNLEKTQKSLWVIIVYALTLVSTLSLSWYIFPKLAFLPYLLFGTKDWDAIWYLIVFYSGLLFIVYIFEFIANIISFGKLSKIKGLINKTLEEIEELKRATSQKVQPFEKAASDYYQAQLRDFFETNLYKKRSGSQQFEEALSEFSSMIEELSTMNSIFITNNTSYWDLRKYKNYLEERTINHNFQSSKKSESLNSVRNFVRTFSKPQEQEQREVVAPEKLYRTARKIDNWEEINKKRKITGLKGEEIAVAIQQDYLESIDRSDLADKVRHVSVVDGDGLGYDILSFFEDGREKFIEVKSTTTSLKSPFYLSRNELGFLNDHNEDYFLYRILVSNDVPQIEIYSSPEVLEMNEILPVQYMVQAK
ncbi:MAG: hypothetical protein A2953_02915 [Candidatus Levybacteria bacterium RIFCSPLOWO2_01_FULL_36_54]|nr:MAG: hypothetical protein A2953_02915 [Candidatus Levybacteria bacterium RIFCSPLOWO2_01_FULL_36_54]